MLKKLIQTAALLAIVLMAQTTMFVASAAETAPPEIDSPFGDATDNEEDDDDDDDDEPPVLSGGQTNNNNNNNNNSNTNTNTNTNTNNTNKGQIVKSGPAAGFLILPSLALGAMLFRRKK